MVFRLRKDILGPLDKRKMNELEKQLDENLLTKIKKGGVVTDQVLNRFVEKDSGKLEIVGKFNYQTKMVHDVYSDFLFRENALPTKRLETDMFKPEDMGEMLYAVNDLRMLVPRIIFSDSEFRKTLDLPSNIYTNKKIAEIVSDYSDLKLKGEVLGYWDEKEDEWHDILLNGSFVDVLIDKPRRIKGNYPEHIYFFMMNIGGFFHFQNFLYHKVKLFPQRFYRMRPESQNLYRFLTRYTNIDLTLNEISKIIGYKEDAKNERQRIGWIINHLDEIKKNRLVQRYRPKGTGKGTVFSISRYQKWPRENEGIWIPGKIILGEEETG